MAKNYCKREEAIPYFREVLINPEEKDAVQGRLI